MSASPTAQACPIATVNTAEVCRYCDPVTDYVLTIDLGTSGPKVAVFSTEGEYFDGDFEPVELILHEGGGAEQRPDDWWTAISRAAKKLAERNSFPDKGFAAVSVTSQWSGTVAVDSNGEPLANAVIWMDSRGARDIAEVVGGPIRVQGYDPRKLRKWISLTGGAPSLSGKDPIAHIHFLRRTRPDLNSATSMYMEPKDWLNLKLTGRACATYDSAVMTWVTDNRDPSNITYDDGLISMARLRREWMPELVAATAVIGEVTPSAAADLGITAGTPVIGGTPDVQSAAVGSGAVRDHEGHLYLGTSSWISCHTSNKKSDVLRGIATLPSPLPGRYFVANEQETAGACLTWLRDQVVYPGDNFAAGECPEDALDRVNQVASDSEPGSRGVIFTPWLNGERTPVDDHTIRGGWHNISLRNDRSDMVRAVMEGVAFNSKWLLDAVEKFNGSPFPYLNVVGGGGISPLWAQIHADVTGRRIRRVADPLQANARGAALLAGLALGAIRQDDMNDMVTIVEEHEPDPANAAVYAKHYRAFGSIYKHNKRIHRQLNS